MATYIPSLTLPAKFFDIAPISILLPVTVGTAVGFSVRPAETQATYLSLKQPPYRPPPQTFAPVWTVLYGLMGYAAHRAWTTGMASMEPHTVELTRRGATVYTVQLGLNLVWMPLFFYFKRPIEATVDIVALTGATGYLAYIWSQVDEVSALCLVPYVGWLGFATYLTAGIGYLNNWTIPAKKSEEKAPEKTEEPTDPESKGE